MSAVRLAVMPAADFRPVNFSSFLQVFMQHSFSPDLFPRLRDAQCHSLAIALVAPLVFLSSAFAAPAEDPITPYRPSVSTPAQLPATGQLEFELGGLHSKSTDERRDSTPYQFKLAFSPQWGVLVGGEAIVTSHDDTGNGGRTTGLGDTNVVLKRAFLVDDATAFGLEAGVKIPTARDAIGSGRADYVVNGIFSRDFGTVHMDSNLNFTRLGQLDPGAGRIQTGLSASFSRPFSARWSGTAELSGTRQGGAASTAQALFALGYSPTKRLTFDFGVARGLNNASPNYALFAGVVMPVAKLW